jgi:hypothetical protein
VFDVVSAVFGWAWDSKRQAVFHCRAGGSPPLPPAYQRPLGMFFASGGLQVLPATGLTKTVRLRKIQISCKTGDGSISFEPDMRFSPMSEFARVALKSEVTPPPRIQMQEIVHR